MTVLLTCGAGYIGSHVAVEPLQSGYDVIIADNFYNSSQEVPERIRKITEKSVRTYNVDIQNARLEENIFYVRDGVPFVCNHMDGGNYTESNDRIIPIEK